MTVSCYNMWSPLRARKIDEEGLLQPFVPFETFGDPATLNCDRDSQGDVWCADMGVSIVRPRNLDHLETGCSPRSGWDRRSTRSRTSVASMSTTPTRCCRRSGGSRMWSEGGRHNCPRGAAP